MKSLSLNIMKKGRVWFECKNNSNYACKLKINGLSENLTEGTHEILVEDISIRSKYGVDVRYEMVAEKSTEKVFLNHWVYNSCLVSACKKLGGCWDAESKSWVFSSIVADRVDELDCKYNGPTAFVEIEAIDDISDCVGSCTYLGYTIARASDRDSGAVLGEGVYQLNGKINSGGSSKYWTTEISKGSKFRLKVPANLIELWREGEAKEWNVTIIENKEV